MPPPRSTRFPLSQARLTLRDCRRRAVALSRLSNQRAAFDEIDRRFPPVGQQEGACVDVFDGCFRVKPSTARRPRPDGEPSPPSDPKEITFKTVTISDKSSKFADDPLDDSGFDKVGILTYMIDGQPDAQFIVMNDASLPGFYGAGDGKGATGHEQVFFEVFERLPRSDTDVCCGFGFNNRKKPPGSARILTFNSVTFNSSGKKTPNASLRPHAQKLWTQYHDENGNASNGERELIKRCWEVYKKGCAPSPRTPAASPTAPPPEVPPACTPIPLHR